jgi:Uma2 family endonuclease
MALSLDSAILELPGPLSRAEYDALVRRGALDDARVELLYGRIVTMSPQGESHSYCVTELSRVLILAIGRRANVRVQMPLAAGSSEPEPDVAVVAPGDYLDEHPTTAWLVIEVADSSLARDRGKAKLYAAAGVTEYWLVNLADEVVEAHTSPGPEGYARVTRRARGETLRVPALADVEVRVADVLPPVR